MCGCFCFAAGAGHGPAKGSLLESLFLSASARLRGSEDEEDSHSQTSCSNSQGSGRSPAHLIGSSAYPPPPYMGPTRSSTSHYDFGGPSYPQGMSNGGMGGLMMSAGMHAPPASAPPRSSLASLLDVARSKRSYEAALGSSSGGETPSQGHLGASAWGESGQIMAGAALMGLNGMSSPPMGMMEAQGPPAVGLLRPLRADDYAVGFVRRDCGILGRALLGLAED